MGLFVFLFIDFMYFKYVNVWFVCAERLYRRQGGEGEVEGGEGERGAHEVFLYSLALSLELSIPLPLLGVIDVCVVPG